MYPVMDVDLGDLSLRTLTLADAALLVEATRGETGTAMWGPRPVGAYSRADAEAALRDWDGTSQVSFGLVEHDRLLATVGLMAEAEIAYWVRPEHRRRGLGVQAVVAVTEWAHEHAGLDRVWLEINPANAASRRLAERAGYRFTERLARHCRAWRSDDPDHDEWHDCLIWQHVSPPSP